jgi:hypothetical protein
MRRGNGLALLLIVIGVALILMKTGILGWLFGLLIPILIIGLGVMAWRNGNRVLGGIVGAVGAIMLVGKLSFLFVWVAAIALIAFGISMLRGKPSTRF